MKDMTIFPLQGGLFLLLIYYIYQLVIFHLQFKKLTRGIKIAALLGVGGLFLFLLLPLLPLSTLSSRILSGSLWGLASFGLLALVANEVSTHPRRHKALLKLPLLGLMMGLTFSREEGRFVGPLLLPFTLFPLVALLHHFKDRYRPAFRSILFAFSLLLMIQALALVAAPAVWSQLLATLLWAALSYYLFEVTNFFLVKRLVQEGLQQATTPSPKAKEDGLSGTLISIVVIAIMVGSGCARFGTLNLQEHQYGVLPTRIVWLQVAGLQDEHLALLKFFRPTTKEETAFEDTGCLGKTWSYNLYHLRPNPVDGLFSQLTGKKNIKNTCADYYHTPIWRIMIDNGYQSGIFESGYAPENFLDRAMTCEGGKEFLRGATVWEMRPFPIKANKKSKKSQDKEKGAEKGTIKAEEASKESLGAVEGPDYFHVQDMGLFESGKIYYDRSCQEQNCFTGLSRNIEYVFQNFQKNRSQYFFLARDFTYFKALKDNDMEKAKEILLEIEKIYRFFLNYQKNDRSMLLLVTSSAPLNFEFPEEGSDWAVFEEKGRPVLYKKTSLLAPVWAKGARAENFCGIYEEAEMVRRISRGPPKVGL